MARCVDTSQAVAGVVFAFNLLPWRGTALLEYIPGGSACTITYLKAQDGSKILIQLRPPQSMSRDFQRLAAWVDLPPLAIASSPRNRTPPTGSRL